MTEIQRWLDAMRVPDTVSTGQAFPWEVRRFHLSEVPATIHNLYPHLQRLAPYESFTMLMRQTMATLHHPIGECVMEDTPRELRRHLPVLMRATGDVLVSGLGLGCVVRGLLSNPAVRHIDVVEIDPKILALCGEEFLNNPRVDIHLGDAETFDWPSAQRWDYAWHDVWSEHEALDVVHARLLVKYAERVRFLQGVWQFDRRCKTLWPLPILGQRRRDLLRATLSLII